MNHLLCYGFGYTAQTLARILRASDTWNIVGTTRTIARAEELEKSNANSVLVLESANAQEQVAAALRSATHLLVSASPGQSGDPMLVEYQNVLRAAPRLLWVGYLSTIGVYGDQNNAWVDEETLCAPTSVRGQRRLKAESAWLDFGKETQKRVQIFRLAGIYGPGRSVLDKLKEGTARRINKPGQVFNRIHVDDIAHVLKAALSGKGTNHIYNVSDDEPAPPQDVFAFGAQLLGVPAPALIPYEEAQLSSMGRSFYTERRRVKNERIKKDLGIALQHPTYREGLRAIQKTEIGATAR